MESISVNYNTNKMKISQLCEKSGFNRSTIRHYIDAGLLHRPLKTGGTVAIYDENHLEKLKRIGHLKEERHSLSEIRSILSQEIPAISEIEQLVRGKREEIIEKAIETFCKKGFIRTRIIDIAKAADLGKSSFYFYFKSKEKLFIECVAHLAEILLSKQKESWDDVKDEQDVVSSQRTGASLYFNYFNYYGGILNSLKLFLKSDNQKMVKLAKEAFRKFLQPIISYHRLTINIGVMRELDEVLVGYSILGLSDIMGYALLLNPQYTLDDIVDFGVDILNHGTLACNAKGEREYQSGPIYFDVTDSQGIKTIIWNTSFAEKKYIPGSIGDGTFQINLTDISSLVINKTGSIYSALITLITGSQSTLEIKGEGSLSGQSQSGKVRLPINKIFRITRIYPDDGDVPISFRGLQND